MLFVNVSNNYQCESSGDRCFAPDSWIVLESRDGSVILGLGNRERDWAMSEGLRIKAGQDRRHESGSLAVNLGVDVAPMAEWTLVFVAPGEPTPTPTPTPTLGPTPTPTPFVIPTAAEFEASLPCLTTADAVYLHDLITQLAAIGEPAVALFELSTSAREDPDVARTAEFQREVASRFAAWRSVLRNMQGLTPPTSSQTQTLHEAVLAMVAWQADLLDYYEAAAAAGDFGRLDFGGLGPRHDPAADPFLFVDIDVILLIYGLCT